MGKTLDIIDQRLELGQTKVISRDCGRIIDYVELLFSPTTKIQLAPTKDNRAIRISVSDNSLELPQLDCTMSRDTLYDYIISLRRLYNQINIDKEDPTQ